MSSFDASLTGQLDFDIQNGPDSTEVTEYFSDSPLPERDMVLVMSYVKRQQWGNVLDCDAGLAKGTIFPELEKPFLGKGGCAR